MKVHIPRCNITNVTQSKNEKYPHTCYVEVKTLDSTFNFSTDGIPAEQLKAQALKPISIKGTVTGRLYQRDQKLAFTNLEIGEPQRD